jgi:hypothetical protein
MPMDVDGKQVLASLDETPGLEGFSLQILCRTRTLDSHVCRLRHKLDRGPDDHFVVNVWGVGYKLLS